MQTIVTKGEEHKRSCGGQDWRVHAHGRAIGLLPDLAHDLAERLRPEPAAVDRVAVCRVGTVALLAVADCGGGGGPAGSAGTANTTTTGSLGGVRGGFPGYASLPPASRG